MKPQQERNPLLDAAGLRRRAEARLRKRLGDRPGSDATPPPAPDPHRLLHALQVHHVELEMQNAELQAARDRLETLLEKYADLYDFAPVGYFSLDEQGRILEVNLTGAALIGVNRSRLVRGRMSRFVTSASHTVFSTFLEQVFAEPGRRVCEAALQREDGTSFWANLHGTQAVSESGPLKCCRVAVSDLTPLKQAENAQRRAEALAATNRELQREIAQRRTVEEALRKSEHQQGQLLEQSHQLQQQLRHLSHEILRAQEEERKRISRELHDEVAQTLVGINVHLANLARTGSRHNPQGLDRAIARTQRLVEKSVSLVHDFARELRPTALDDLGLIPTLHSFLKDFTRQTGIRVRFATVARTDRIDSNRRTVLYRLVQSALSNVARHSQASSVEISLGKVPGGVRLEISDNGKSFPVERVLHAKKIKRLGLIGMRERVEMVGGDFRIESAPGHGTTIRAQIPLDSRATRGRATRDLIPTRQRIECR